jgi:hypothetical protein
MVTKLNSKYITFELMLFLDGLDYSEHRLIFWLTHFSPDINLTKFLEIALSTTIAFWFPNTFHLIQTLLFRALIRWILHRK